jgi:hypothetical protein
MYAQIVIDCQTQNEIICCEYCIVKRSCKLRLQLENKKTLESTEMLTPLLLIEA